MPVSDLLSDPLADQLFKDLAGRTLWLFCPTAGQEMAAGSRQVQGALVGQDLGGAIAQSPNVAIGLFPGGASG